LTSTLDLAFGQNNKNLAFVADFEARRTIEYAKATRQLSRDTNTKRNNFQTHKCRLSIDTNQSTARTTKRKKKKKKKKNIKSYDANRELCGRARDRLAALGRIDAGRTKIVKVKTNDDDDENEQSQQ
jgi:hypothetical protein